jgi:hypothetical protein
VEYARGVIAVIGSTEPAHAPVSVISIAAAAVRSGAATQLVSAIPDDAGGDRRMAEVAALGIGHAAVLRTTAASLDPADLELALQYLPDLTVIVAAVSDPALAETAARAAEWSDAQLVVISRGDPTALSTVEQLARAGRATVLEAPARDLDGMFAGLVGRLVADLDSGAPPADAWRAVLAATGADRVSPLRAR